MNRTRRIRWDRMETRSAATRARGWGAMPHATAAVTWAGAPAARAAVTWADRAEAPAFHIRTTAGTARRMTGWAAKRAKAARTGATRRRRRHNERWGCTPRA